MAENVDYKKIIQQEYIKCAQDPMYFFRKYMYIAHRSRGRIKFDLYKFQELAFDQIINNDYNIVLKARQMGISTLVAGYALWLMLFKKDQKILVIATKQDVAKNLVTMVRYANSNLPKWLQNPSIEDNKLSLKFNNGSEIKAIASSPDAGRSESLSLLILDEAAFIEYIDQIWGSAQQTLATGGKCIALSTPNGVGNWFHQQWIGAKEKSNSFNPINLHWSLHPERDQDWREKQDQILGKKLASQECDCDFVTSGHTVIEGETLEWYKTTHVKDPIEKRGRDSNIWIWEYPDYTKDYIISADVARGDGQDFSAFHILEVESMKQIASYKGKIETKEYGRLLGGIGMEYNNALIVVENANIGWAVLQELIDADYPNLFYSSRDMQVVDVHYSHINKDTRNLENPTVPGFTTSTKTRPMLISKLDEYLRQRDVVIQDSRLVNELFTFIWNGQKAEAMRGYNDDMVMSYAIGLWVRDTALRLRQEGIELTKQSLKHMYRSDTVISTGNYDGDNPYKKTINGEEIDLRWLFD
jgi:hypothetical protein